MKNGIKKILSFLDQLKKAKIYHSVHSTRDEAISVDVSVPGERWEIDFLEDGSIDVEVFKSDGTIHDKSKLTELFNRFSD